MCDPLLGAAVTGAADHYAGVPRASVPACSPMHCSCPVPCLLLDCSAIVAMLPERVERPGSRCCCDCNPFSPASPGQGLWWRLQNSFGDKQSTGYTYGGTTVKYPIINGEFGSTYGGKTEQICMRDIFKCVSTRILTLPD